MKKIDFTRLKYYILGIVFVVTAAITFLSMNYKIDLPVSTTMDSANLPIVTMQTENGILFNELHGYIFDMDTGLLNDSVTPLPDDKNLKIVIQKYSDDIKGISYKIRKFDDKSLIEDTKVTDFAADGQNVNAVLPIKNLIESNTEYLLEINLSTNSREDIHYYTKIISNTGLNLEDKLSFVTGFNEATMDTSRLDEISKYLEPKASADNSNFGKVNINSSKTQIGWGELNPRVEMTIIPTVKEIGQEVAQIYLEYMVAAQSDANSYNHYRVNEYYRLRQSGKSMYLLDYERETDQIFDSVESLTEDSKIRLGVTSDENVHMKASPKGDYALFVNQGTLWEFSKEDKQFTRVFSFEAENSDNKRELYNKHDIKIMDIDDDGNINFIVYGYMNRGAHEGGIGISLYRYEQEKNIVNEMLYIPVEVPFEQLKENVGQVAYISNNIFYIMLSNSLYSVDLSSKEVMVEISGLADDTYSVSESGTSIAYSLNGKLNDTNAVRILNLTDGSDYQVKADENDRLRVLGYVKNDCIIGVAHSSDVLVEQNGNVTFPMYRIDIYDSHYNIIKTYQTDGIYVSSATVEGMRINLNRVTKNAEGNYESTSMDQLLNREENTDDSGLQLDSSVTQKRGKELFISLAYKVNNSGVTTRASKEVVFNSSKSVNIKANFDNPNRYYVYGLGKFQGSFTNVNKAFSTANETNGMIMDMNSDYIWKKYKATTASVNKTFGAAIGGSSLSQAVELLLNYAGADSGQVKEKFANSETAVDIINEQLKNRALNLRGVKLDDVLYYISVGIPVIGRLGNDKYVLITAYDSKNLTYYDPASQTSENVLISDADREFTQWGNTFITYRVK